MCNNLKVSVIHPSIIRYKSLIKVTSKLFDKFAVVAVHKAPDI